MAALTNHTTASIFVRMKDAQKSGDPLKYHTLLMKKDIEFYHLKKKRERESFCVRANYYFYNLSGLTQKYHLCLQ